ncbi:hypothetical protein SAMN05421734_106165 [Pelagirhabdus alkalitolerans]|uniref:Uncharacterized protein n=1 Tax=Pelagirhabdus alkalitolerans TaxID=1612202 RepID=A0A1G6KPZ5_9BACI|nr:DUF6171 family protein [Pelagirhabdus alkalitolerans]SDC33033.1 hypothetical protein SAMN05421734_106165 [Pelagirhabdus alkalitolerans]
MTCKGCLETVHYTKEEVHALVEEQLLFEENLVDEATYQNRLDECEKCPHLQYETTCGFCGCFVAFRAKLADKECPSPENKRWYKKKGVT